MTDTAPTGSGAAAQSGARALVAVLVGAKVLLHLVLIGRYGYHRDEFYFIQCGEYLAFGYVDHAPLVPWLARLAGLFEHHIAALRMPSVLAGAVTVALTMRLAREWGGGLLARGVAGAGVLAAPAYLRMSKILCIPVFEPMWWTLAALLVSRSARDGNARRWALIGLVAGLGLLTKHTMLFWSAGIAVAAIATPALRIQLKTRWPWLGAGIAALVFSPNIAWQLQNGCPTLDFMNEMRSGVLDAIPKPLFLGGQLIYMNPIAVPLWLWGLWTALRLKTHPARPFAILFLVVCGLLLLMGGKPYYLAPAFPPLFAAGGLALEGWARGRASRRIGVHLAGVGAVVLGICASLPVFDLRATERVMGKALGWAVPPIALTHDLRDEHGWEEMTQAVSRAYRSLTPSSRKQVAILTGNYGEASALRFFGENLPPAVTGHMNYHLWGPPGVEPKQLLVLGVRDKVLRDLCVSAEVVERNTATFAHPFEERLPVYHCASLKQPLSEYWSELRWYGHGAKDGSRAIELERH